MQIYNAHKVKDAWIGGELSVGPITLWPIQQKLWVAMTTRYSRLHERRNDCRTLRACSSV